VEKVRWLAGHLEEVLGAALLSAMVCLAFTNVVTRYVLHLPLAFTEELEVNGLVWLTLFGTSAAFRRGRHLRMHFFQEKLPETIRLVLNLILTFLAVCLFTSLGYLGYIQLLDERLLEITSESLNLPQWLYTICIPIGCGLIVYRIIEAAFREIRRGI
jgi:TRAP-type C4-dicarboxylate transport system permease small subunit